MRFATISTLRHTSQPAIVLEDRAHTLPYPDMLAMIAEGAEKAAKKAAKESLSVDEVQFLSPLKPTTLREGYAFEQHVVTANRNRGRDVPPEWYEFPVFYFTNPNAPPRRRPTGRPLRTAGWPSRPGEAGPGYQVLPGEAGMDGFYYACLTRHP